MKPLLYFVLVWVWANAPSAASDRIWAAVVLATNEEPPRAVPERLETFAPTLRGVFGYNSFYLLGEKSRTLQPGKEEWLVPSRRIFMKVAVLEAMKAAYRLRIELYEGKKQLITTEALLARDAPLYIRGPAWGKGQLIALLEVP